MLGKLFLWFFSILILISFTVGDWNVGICDEILTNDGLIPPILPEKFSMKSLYVNSLSKKFTWVENYFDPVNLRAKLLSISNGKEETYIYDYQRELLTTYMRLHPGAPIQDDPQSEVVCLTQRMADSEYRHYMGYKLDRVGSKVSAMYNSYENLQFGGPYKYAQLNNSKELLYRNTASDAFVGCVYDQYRDETVKNIFYWSKDLETASMALTAPLKIESNGGYFKDSQWIPINSINEIVFFDDTPVMTDQMFQPPPRMNCHMMDDTFRTPEVTEAFSARIESIVTVENFNREIKSVTQDWYEEMWYDYNRKLARQDFYPTLLKNNKENIPIPDQAISSVYDFNTGIVYYTDKVYGKCFAMEIPEQNEFATKSPDGKTLDMITKDKIFDFFNENMHFKGKYKTRDILCNVWSGEQDVKNKEDGTSSKAYREVYFTTDGWHQETDSNEKYNIPVQETRVYPTQHDGQEAMAFMEINFYKFKMEQSPLAVFDISGCIEQIERRSFVMQFDADFRDLINNHKHLFMDSFRAAAVKNGKLRSLLRIQELDVIFNEGIGTVHVYFTLLDKTKLKDSHKYPKWFVDLKTAIKNLEDNYNAGKFIVELQIDPKAEPTKLIPIENTFKEVDFKTNTLVDIEENYQMRSDANDLPNPPTKKEKNEDTSVRYAPGAVGGLAAAMLIVGIGLGIIAMLFYMKKINLFSKRNNSNVEAVEFATEP